MVTTFIEFVLEAFGPQLASNVRHEKDIIPTKHISKINEKDLHPFVVPIYRELYSKEIETGYWSQILWYMLKCKSVREQKLNKVYKATYETLTGKSIQETTFYLLPDSDQHLWNESYVEDQEVNSNVTKLAQHTKQCVNIVVDLSKFCKHYNITIPDLNQTEFYEQLNFEELSRKQTPLRRNTKSLSEELREEFEEKSQLFPLKDHKLIEGLKLQFNQSAPDYKAESEEAQENLDDTYESCADSEIDTIRESSEENTNSANSDSKEPDSANKAGKSKLNSPLIYPRPPPTNPSFEAEADISAPKHTSSPKQIKKQQTTGKHTNNDTNMARNYVRKTDFLPSKFHPAKNEDAMAHMYSFRDFISAQLGVNDISNVELTPEQLDMFKHTCQGEARLWYEANKPFDCLQTLEDQFLREFAADLRSTSVAAKTFSELKYDPRTKLSAFVNKIQRLNTTLNYQDAVLKDKFLLAIPGDIRRLAKLSHPSCFREAVEAVKSILEDPDTTDTDKNNVALVGTDSVTEALEGITFSIQNLQKDIHNIKNQQSRSRNFETAQSNQERNYEAHHSNQFSKYFQGQRRFNGPPGGRPQYNGPQQMQYHGPQHGQQYNGPPPPRYYGQQSGPQNNRGPVMNQYRQQHPEQYNRYPSQNRGRGGYRQGPQRNWSQVQCEICLKPGHTQYQCRSRNSNYGRNYYDRNRQPNYNQQ